MCVCVCVHVIVDHENKIVSKNVSFKQVNRVLDKRHLFVIFRIAIAHINEQPSTSCWIYVVVSGIFFDFFVVVFFWIKCAVKNVSLQKISQ